MALKGWPWAVGMALAITPGMEVAPWGWTEPPLRQHAQMKEANPALLLISSNPRA